MQQGYLGFFSERVPDSGIRLLTLDIQHCESLFYQVTTRICAHKNAINSLDELKRRQGLTDNQKGELLTRQKCLVELTTALVTSQIQPRISQKRRELQRLQQNSLRSLLHDVSVTSEGSVQPLEVSPDASCSVVAASAG